MGFPAAPRHGDGAVLLQPRGAAAAISIGQNTVISNNTSVVAMGEIKIGNDCLIGDLVQIMDCDFHELDPLRRKQGVGLIEPVMIGDNVWLGSRVIVLRGVSIGENSVIGVGSIVTRPIPANCIAAGAPARVVREL